MIKNVIHQHYMSNNLVIMTFLRDRVGNAVLNCCKQNKNSCIITQLWKSIGVCQNLLHCDWCDKWRHWFLPDDPVETQRTPLSPVLIIAPAAPWGPSSNVKFWLIYSGLGTTPSTSSSEQAEIYPWASEWIGELHEKQVQGLFFMSVYFSVFHQNLRK